MMMNKYCRALEEEWKPRHSNTSFVLRLLVGSVFDRLWETEVCVLKVSHELHCKLSKRISVPPGTSSSSPLSCRCCLRICGGSVGTAILQTLLGGVWLLAFIFTTTITIIADIRGDSSFGLRRQKWQCSLLQDHTDSQWCEWLSLGWNVAVAHFIHLVQEIRLTFPR